MDYFETLILILTQIIEIFVQKSVRGIDNPIIPLSTDIILVSFLEA